MRRPWIVAIPARNEAARIEGCLRALAEQDGVHAGRVVLLVNNSSDDTARLARNVRFPPGVALDVIEKTLPPALANAGTARRLVMQHAANSVGHQGVLLTTDADGLVDPDWVAANLACIDAGADAVAGWVDIFATDWSHIPSRLHQDDARECAYDTLCDEIQATLDPDPADPLPRHTQNSGASIAVTAHFHAKCGGVPAVTSGEDRAFIEALRRVDARIRHAPEVHVQVSGRIEGRCKGGMADTIRRRLIQPDEYIDDRLEPAAQCALRAGLRATLRVAYDHGQCQSAPPLAGLANALGISPATLAAKLSLPYFGMAWHEVQAAARLLRPQRVATDDLARETEAATNILSALRQPALMPELAEQADLVARS